MTVKELSSEVKTPAAAVSWDHTTVNVSFNSRSPTVNSQHCWFQVGRAGNTQRPKSVAQWSVVDVQVFTRIQKHFLGGEKVTYPSIEMVETTLRRFLPSVLWGVSGTGPLLIRVVIWMIFWAGGDRSVPCKDDWEQSHAVGYHPPWTQVITLRNTKINCSMFQTIHMEGNSQAQAAVLHLIPEGSGWFSKDNVEFWHKIHFRNGDWPALFNLVNTQKSIRPLIWWQSFCDEQKPRLKP